MIAEYLTLKTVILYAVCAIIAGVKQYKAEMSYKANKPDHPVLVGVVFGSLLWPVAFFAHGLYGILFDDWADHYGIDREDSDD